AYVPPGSLKKGEALVITGITAAGAKVTACTVCHGSDLRGLGPVPTIAGRSPSYTARQLYDMQHGKRNGLLTPLMAAVVAGLCAADRGALPRLATSVGDPWNSGRSRRCVTKEAIRRLSSSPTPLRPPIDCAWICARALVCIRLTSS